MNFMKVFKNFLFRKLEHLHQEALVVVPQAAVGLQQALEMLPEPRSLVGVLRTQPGDKQHSVYVTTASP